LVGIAHINTAESYGTPLNANGEDDELSNAKTPWPEWCNGQKLPLKIEQHDSIWYFEGEPWPTPGCYEVKTDVPIKTLALSGPPPLFKPVHFDNEFKEDARWYIYVPDTVFEVLVPPEAYPFVASTKPQQVRWEIAMTATIEMGANVLETIGQMSSRHVRVITQGTMPGFTVKEVKSEGGLMYIIQDVVFAAYSFIVFVAGIVWCAVFALDPAPCLVH
jgi:hypothetical protein